METAIKIKKVHIILNPSSGKKEPMLSVINESFCDTGIEWDVSITKKFNDATHFAQAAVKKKVDVIAVYGGDGTVMEVVGGMVGSEIPLAILPGGTANVMSKELGIPQNLAEACKLITEGAAETRAVDVGQMDKRYFILRTSLGFEADMVEGADGKTKSRIGTLAYFFSAMDALRKLQSVRYDLTIDGRDYHVWGYTCIIANSGNTGIGKLSLDKDISVSDGLLDILIVRKANFRLFAHVMATLLKRKRSENVELVKHWQGKEIKVVSKPRQILQCDGEVLDKNSLSARVIPSAIRVIVPKMEENKI